MTALAYADNVAITSDSASGDERTLHRLQFYSEAVGFKLNMAKTKVLHVGYESDPEPILTLDGTTMDVCDIYNYLGLMTLSSKVVIRCQNNSCICSEAPPLIPTMSNMLNAGNRLMIHAALGINWQNNITSKDAYAKSGLLLFSQTIRKRRLRLIGHSLCLQSRSITPLLSMLQHLNVLFSVQHGQGRT